MAINPNPSLPNRNTIYLGASGSGKSQCLKQNPDIPKAGARVFLYDPNQDHKAHHYQAKKDFGRAALAALKSGKGFRIAYSGGYAEADHEWFCELMFSILNGKKITYIIDEELGASGNRSGKAAPHHARLLNQGRKYGMIYHGVVQFPTEVAKTVYRNCDVKYCGILETEIAKRMAVEINVPWEKIVNQVPLQFWHRDPQNGMEARQIQFSYQK
ncbi:MAG: hypothetical protein CMQ38_08045 [Gammaproteobacteria bacterium]|nr:hypothetical protein [Gammaproteobacteria bacterium]